MEQAGLVAQAAHVANARARAEFQAMQSAQVCRHHHESNIKMAEENEPDSSAAPGSQHPQQEGQEAEREQPDEAEDDDIGYVAYAYSCIFGDDDPLEPEAFHSPERYTEGSEPFESPERHGSPDHDEFYWKVGLSELPPDERFTSGSDWPPSNGLGHPLKAGISEHEELLSRELVAEEANGKSVHYTDAVLHHPDLGTGEERWVEKDHTEPPCLEDSPLDLATLEARRTLERHEQEAMWSPTVMLYDVSMDPPRVPSSPSNGSSPSRRRAYHSHLNTRTPTPIENEHFQGSFLFMHRADEEMSEESFPYASYFAKKTRRWELRIQGRFRRRPKGKLYAGMVLEDFDYSLQQSWSSTILANVATPIIQSVLGQAIYFSWGDRCEDSARPDAELASMVADLTGFDQVITTEPGEQPPDMTGDIDHLGYRRNGMRMEEYREVLERITNDFNTEDVYTLCFWGISRFVDVITGALLGINPLGSLSINSFLEEWPAHMVMYFLEDAEDDDPRHLERRKSYCVDIMFWSTSMLCPQIASRYTFFDGPGSDDQVETGKRALQKRFMLGARRWKKYAEIARRKTLKMMKCIC